MGHSPRLKLPRSLRWLDVDLPSMISYRRDCLDAETPACKHAHVAADMSEADERARVLALARESEGPLLVVSEGLLVYLSPVQVADLATQLHAEAQARWWLADLITPLLQRAMGGVWQSQLANAWAPINFAPADSRRFFAELGWHEEAFRSTWTESIRLGRPAPHGVVLDGLSKLSGPAGYELVKRMSGVALFERALCPGQAHRLAQAFDFKHQQIIAGPVQGDGEVVGRGCGRADGICHPRSLPRHRLTWRYRQITQTAINPPAVRPTA